jgi:hypothetical protein
VATTLYFGTRRIGSRFAALVTTAANNRLNVAPTLGTPKMTVLITYNGHTNTISGWAAKNGITRAAFRQRLRRGWTEAEACSIKRVNGNSRKEHASIKQPTSITSLRLDELKRIDLMLQRDVNRTLRQFCRDVDAIMSRGVDRDILKARFDRSIPVARDLPEIGNS